VADILTRNWWLVAVRGALAILFGVAAFVWPGATLQALVLLFGAYALVDGIFAVASGVSGGSSSDSSRWFLILGGIAGVIVGLITFFYPNITATALLYVIGLWAIVTGAFEVIGAIQLRQIIPDEWLLIFSGVLSVVFGVLAFVYPQATALSIVWLIALYAVVFGIATVALGFRMRSIGKTLSTQPTGTL
jgi:uncharacterized membrane protein HdeD (DUF308 family)